jgi:hypothetical protein
MVGLETVLAIVYINSSAMHSPHYRLAGDSKVASWLHFFGSGFRLTDSEIASR